MELTESIEVINKRLLDHFGRFDTGDPNFRIVWADDEFENVMSQYTDAGILLNTPVMRRKPKYGYLKHLYVLERIMPVPVINNFELMQRRTSYEPLWAFADANDNPVPPIWSQIKTMLEVLIYKMNNPGKPYEMDEKDHNTFEALEDKAKKMEELLFGNETAVGDALSQGTAVGYGTYRRNDSRFDSMPKLFFK